MNPTPHIFGQCQTCGKHSGLYRHHVVPKKVTRQRGIPNSKTIRICQCCHVIIHIVPNITLADFYNEASSLRALIIVSRLIGIRSMASRFGSHWPSRQRIAELMLEYEKEKESSQKKA